jgi:hypothetical protein
MAKLDRDPAKKHESGGQLRLEDRCPLPLL